MTYSGSDQAEKVAQSGFRVLYICSSGRSGSTFTDMFMGGHSQVASLGQINVVGKAISVDSKCSCGSELRACVQWRKVFDAIQSSHGIDMTKDPYAFKLWDALAFQLIDHRRQTYTYRLAVALRKAWMEGRDHLPQSLRKHFPIPPTLLEALHNKMDLFRIISRCWDKVVIVDSSKNVREAVELHQRWPDLVKVVQLTRDGRGVYLSRRSSGFSQSESAEAWVSYYRRALPLLENYIAPGSLHKIRYEDLASDPEKTGRVLCDFIGISFEPEMLDLSRSTRHLVGGNTTRFAPGKGIKLDERWRTELQGEELNFFNRVGGELNHRLGYR